jgi:hypothetical protein
MGKTQKHFSSNPYVFFILCLILTISFFIIFSPKVSAILLPVKSEQKLNSFMQSIKRDKSVNAQTFWEFREFYSPGSFTFSSRGLPSNKTSQVISAIDVPMNYKALTPFSIYTSPRVESIDFYTTAATLNDIMPSTPSGKIIFQDAQSIALEAPDNRIKVVFIKSYSEMQKAVGFFTIHEDDGNIIKDKNWVNITSIDTN